MSKNIILCSDGTGNRGGYTPDTNVFKIYNLVDIHNEDQEQVAYYDNGVGTSSISPLKLLTAAFGVGFKKNVIDQYRYLAQRYVPGDDVFIFGFSRGAATARAFNGFIDCCGLIDGRNMKKEELDDLIEDHFEQYKNSTKNKHQVHPVEEGVHHGKIQIKFIGVWDTVSALGGPQHTEVHGLLSWLAGVAFKFLDWFADILFPHRFYNYRITDNVINAYQALAVDDERTSFWPMVWDENDHQPIKYPSLENKPEDISGEVEQAWFPGMHSNIGGGYNRDGLACLTLKWMMIRAAHHGIIFESGALQKVTDSCNIEGLMQNSRSGFALLYRYHPRVIESLCENKMKSSINIHHTVVERMAIWPADYKPTSLPDTFNITSSSLNADQITLNPGAHQDWQGCRTQAEKCINARKIHYNRMITGLVTLLVASGYFWMNTIEHWGRSGLNGHVADILTYFTPVFFHNIIELGISSNPQYGILFTILIIILYLHWKKLKLKTKTATTKLKNIVTKAYSGGRK